jgi:hypothetical protein
VPRDLDREIMNEMGALGLLGSTIEGYGCADHARGLSIAGAQRCAPSVAVTRARPRRTGA